MIGLFFGAVQLTSVQTFLARRATAYLSSELNTRVSIDRVGQLGGVPVRFTWPMVAAKSRELLDDIGSASRICFVKLPLTSALRLATGGFRTCRWAG